MNTTHLPSMSWPKSILVATDLNDLDSLLPVAIDQARVTGAMIWLLHVIPPEAYVSIEAGAYPFVGKEKEYRRCGSVVIRGHLASAWIDLCISAQCGFDRLPDGGG